jgi:peptidoglycan/LPS O-acetylase OafA/YrhL
LFAAVVVLAIAARPEHRAGRLLHGRTLRFFGKYSYALYVFHPLLVPSLRRWIPADVLATRIGALPALLFHLSACLAMSLGIAWLSWHVYEKHFLKLKRFFEYRPLMPSSPPTPKNPPTAPLRLPIVPMNSRRAS